MVDDSNEHMLSVWDCSRGIKLAEIKVRRPHGLGGFEVDVAWEKWSVDSSSVIYTFTSFLAGPLSALASLSVKWGL